MYVQTGKTFIATLIAVVLALGGLAWLSSGSHKDSQAALAQTYQSASATQPVASNDSTANATEPSNASSSSYEEGYKAGYRDGHEDCTTRRTSAGRYYAPRARVAGTRYYAPRTRVAGASYYAARRGHSTRNMILTIAAPAAIGAGIGAIAHGGKGAGIGALIGGGGGALYHLIKHRRD